MTGVNDLAALSHRLTPDDVADGVVREDAPDIILLDLKMPRCDGYEFRRRQLADVRWKDIPVVVFTADANVEGVDAQSLGGVPIVRKSAEFSALLATVERAYDNSRQAG